jgi:hypothetical protein
MEDIRDVDASLLCPMTGKGGGRELLDVGAACQQPNQAKQLMQLLYSDLLS